jgi:SAM-dependent methyltransferase
VDVQGYEPDLAYIHDAGHSEFALNCAPGILRLLRRHGIRDGLIVDLGCGSGRWAGELSRAGYDVVGIDQSPAMIQLARRRAPQCTFHVGSLLAVDLPACNAVTSLGECLNYCFDETNSRRALLRLFKRVYCALRPGGLFVFDVAGPARFPSRTPHRTWREGADWAVLVRTDGDREQNVLERHIVTFRKRGQLYRRSEELHRLRLYSATDLVDDLIQCGFDARSVAAYGRFRLPRGMAGIVAVKR